MTTDEVLAAVNERGLKLHAGSDGTLIVIGLDEEKTPALLRVLGWHRDGIINRIRIRDSRRPAKRHGEWSQRI